MTSYAYFQKKFVPFSEAKLGVMTNFLHYGTAVFEGIRGNWNGEKQQIFIFRLKEHYERLLNGARLLKMDVGHSMDELCQLTVELVRKSGFKDDIYLRPVAYKSTEALGVRLYNLEADFLLFAIPWGPYLECEAARCLVSSWRRPEGNMIPPQAKITGIYVNNALAKTQAIDSGYDEAIMLSPAGYVSEGSGENIFLVIDGQLVTPSINSSILKGITRDTVIQIAQKEMGMSTVERFVERQELYIAQEIFLTGTAAHITPVGEVDHYLIGDGHPGPITKKLQEIYAEVIRGNNPKYVNWCTPVYSKQPLKA